jgi:hypothetical protein
VFLTELHTFLPVRAELVEALRPGFDKLSPNGLSAIESKPL